MRYIYQVMWRPEGPSRVFVHLIKQARPGVRPGRSFLIQRAHISGEVRT